MILLRTLGGLSLERDGTPLSGPAVQRRRLALLTLLASHGERGVSREKLAAWLWPESDEESARNSMKQAVFVLRRELGQDVIVGTRELRLDTRLVEWDVRTFERCLDDGAAEAALERYAGPFLDGVHLNGDAAEFERWADAERVRLAARRAEALECLARAEPDPVRAAGWWRRRLDDDPLDTRVAAELVAALARSGHHAGALREAEAHRVRLAAELGLEPDAAFRRLVERLRAGELMMPAAGHPPEMPRSPSSPPEAAATPAAPDGRGAEPAVVGAPVPPPARRGRRWLVGATLVLATAAGGAAIVSMRHPPALDDTLVAVAPFGVPDAGLELWREGLVDVLARNLDDAGPLRTVPPTVAIRRFEGRDDTRSANRLGRRTGAAIVVHGSLLRAGPDSVRLLARLHDARRNRTLAAFEGREALDRIERLTDSVSVWALSELGRIQPITATRAAALGTIAVPALRAFLRAEQFYRRTAWDSALAYYEVALRLDSSSALAFRHRYSARGWLAGMSDSLARAMAARASPAPRLTTRDSLALAIELHFSRLEDVSEPPNTARSWDAAEQLLRACEEAVRRYPEDPEAWHMLGDARFHVGHLFGVPNARALDAFDVAIELDSGFALPYVHAMDLALNVRGPAEARRYASAYLRLDQRGDDARAAALLLRLTTPGRWDRELAASLDSVDGHALGAAMLQFMSLRDPYETAVRIFRHNTRPPAGTSERRWLRDRRYWAGLVAYRGHLREAYREVGTLGHPSLYEVPVWVGIVSPDTARVLYDRWQRERSDASRFALAWWAARRDTAALDTFARWRDSAVSAAPHPRVAIMHRYLADAARAYRALAAGDSAAALTRLLAMPDSACPGCNVQQLLRVQLLAAAGRLPEAWALIREDPISSTPPSPVEVLWLLERGRVAERLERFDEAARAYRAVTEAWREPDAELEPWRREALDAPRRERRMGSPTGVLPQYR